MKLKKGIILVLLVILIPQIYCNSTGKNFFPYPEIHQTNPSDPVYKQLTLCSAQWYRENSKQITNSRLLSIFTYQVKKDEDIFTIAAQMGIPYATLATINKIERSSERLKGRTLMIPSSPGIFINTDDKQNQFNAVIKAGLKQKKFLKVKLADNSELRFYPGAKLDEDARAIFLNYFFRSPLGKSRITSPFGPRPNPFTGTPSIHRGIDLSAKTGTRVMAAKDGIISEKGFSSIYGRYIIIKHSSGFETFYGHLNKILVEYNSKVNVGDIIAHSGSSGRTTGPHLHFEVRFLSKPYNPADYINF